MILRRVSPSHNGQSPLKEAPMSTLPIAAVAAANVAHTPRGDRI